MAMNSTAAQLVRIVHLYKAALESHALELANTRNDKRHLDYFFEDDGFLVIKGRLCPENGALTARRLSCDASIVSMHHGDHGPLSVGRKTRNVPIGIRKALHIRDLGCRFPGCDGYRHVERHHIQHWTRQGPTSLDNLLYLCTFHHRLVHEGGYGVEGEPDVVRFRRPASQGGDLVELVRPVATTPEAIVQDNHNRGLDIDSDTAISGWDGANVHWGDVIGAIAQDDSRFHDPPDPPEPDP